MYIYIYMYVYVYSCISIYRKREMIRVHPVKPELTLLFISF